MVTLWVSFVGVGQQRMMLFFKDKASSNAHVEFSERSLNRRSNQEIVVNELDRNVNTNYLNRLNEYGTVVSVSRWLNGVVFETKLSEKEVLKTFDFVKEVRGRMSIPHSVPASISKSFNYGAAWNQVNQINVDCLHQDGAAGEGVYLAVIDAGFVSMDTLPIFRKAYQDGRVLDTWNFVNPGLSVYGWHPHGTRVASCIFGNQSGGDGATESYVGTAPNIDVALYLTEDVGSETEIEEFYLVAALERCDSVGVDVANISLGYLNFDDPATSHVFGELDGKTTIAAKGINIAKSKGIAVVTSAGNTGPSHITTPCDADGGLCVGAVDESGEYASFSSVGPSVDGQVKPDVMARGASAMLINEGSGTIDAGNGTSFSSPIIAGSIACLRQVHPKVSVDELFNALRESGTQFQNPNEFMGYGIPDLCYAHLLLTRLEATRSIQVYPNPASESITVISNSDDKEMQLLDAFGKLVWSASNQSLITTIPTENLADGTYILKIYGAQNQISKVIVLH